MVVPLGPGKFYGSSLPRPRIYTDVKHSEERVDPPVSVLDPFLSWANEAHWSMGGLSFKRLRLQGRIEGSVTKLRNEHEKLMKKQAKKPDSPKGSGPNRPKRVISLPDSESPPPAPIATKRRRFLALVDDDEEAEEPVVVVKRRLVKKLGDDFDRVAMESERSKGEPVKDLGHGSGSGMEGTRTPSRGVGEVGEQLHDLDSKGKKLKGGSSRVSRVRTSPRLAKRGSS
jgi:hypothetical protein